MAAQSDVTRLGEEIKMKMVLLDAETQFWRLALSREAIQVTKESVDRAKKLREWAKRRADTQLADTSDFLQTDAVLRARNLELQLANDEENASIRMFNTLRGREENTVAEQLPQVVSSIVEGANPPVMKDSRPDVKLSEHLEKIAKISQQNLDRKIHARCQCVCSSEPHGERRGYVSECASSVNR